MAHDLFLPASVVLAASFIAAATDVWKFRVYNALTVPLFLSGLLYHGLMAGGPGVLGSLGGALVGFAALITFYAMGGMGAGDVKLMAAVGAWLGMPLILYVVLASALAAGAYAIVLTLCSGSLKETWLNLRLLVFRVMIMGRHLGSDDDIEVEVRRAGRHRRLIPFAAMIAVGLVATFVWISTEG